MIAQAGLIAGYFHDPSSSVPVEAPEAAGAASARTGPAVISASGFAITLTI
jgi:hypothetical protein